MDQVRYGVIGIGNMGTQHTDYLFHGKVEGATVTAACDLKQERLDWVKEMSGGAIACFTDYRDLLKSGLCDAVIIAVPHYLHPIIGIEAFEAGLHVLSEKPIGVFTQNIHDFIAAAKKSGKAFGIMYNQRTNPTYQKVREMVQSGQLGQLKRCVWIITNWYRTEAYYRSGGWRATWEGEGGGVLLNQSPHNIDLWQWIFGMPTRLRAFCEFGKYHDIEVEDDVTCYAQYENGATGVFITTTGEFPGTNRLEISGTLGKLVYEEGKLTFYKLGIDEREFNAGTTSSFASIPYEKLDVSVEDGGKQHVGITQNFTDHILHGTPLLAPGEEGIHMLTLANAMMMSTWEDDWVSLPIDAEAFRAHLNKQIRTSTHEKKQDAPGGVADLSGTFNTK